MFGSMFGYICAIGGSTSRNPRSRKKARISSRTRARARSASHDSSPSASRRHVSSARRARGMCFMFFSDPENIYFKMQALSGNGGDAHFRHPAGKTRGEELPEGLLFLPRQPERTQQWGFPGIVASAAIVEGDHILKC